MSVFRSIHKAHNMLQKSDTFHNGHKSTVTYRQVFFFPLSRKVTSQPRRNEDTDEMLTDTHVQGVLDAVSSVYVTAP
jgi:hypothetical protein